MSMSGGKSDVKVAFITDEIAADPDGISASAQVANNAALVIGGALHSGNAIALAGAARKIEITSGAIIIAVVRKNQPYPNPEPEFLIMSGDMLILFGSHMQLDKSIEYLQKGPQ